MTGNVIAFLGIDIACHAAAVGPELIIGAPELHVVLLLCQLDVKSQLGPVEESFVLLSFGSIVQ
jgi:hypothetical protein